MASVGRNIVFPIKNADDTPFHDLVLRKATVDSVVMSLGDKITGDVYYKDNTLQCTMQEYVKYNNVKYTIVNPPTIVREGLVKDNSDLKGMTKYSFEFYHPMYILGNLPFSDVAVSNDEKKYLSQNKTFSWIGKPQDYINKINKNLEGTEWIVVKSDRFPKEKDDELSDVLSFDNNTIADALKTGYETWGLPYVVSQINIGEPYYSQGKRFKVEFGLPSNEILVDNEPYIFQFGQGVGLKNNSRTPRNNKIITRIAGYGSENNIPYGYPQIRWYGDQSATQTPAGYPIYDGIVGGVVRKLIKHPFTRTHLMPSIYTQTVFNKVSPYLENGSANPDYNPNEEIIDYYDAVYSEEYQYINEINLLAPSYEIHAFDEIKPELDSDRQLGIVSAIPLNQDFTPASQWDDTYDAEKDEYVQSYFKITLPQLSFDLYACASIMEEMQVNMRSGACIGCTFTIQVDWEDYKRNFYDADENFLPDGSQRDLTKYPKSNLGQIDIIVHKETQTFGTLMPNIYQQPKANDLFVILGISLPLEYITNAEERLDDAMKSYMLENNVYYYDYPLKFDEHFLSTHTNILSQIRPNSIIRFGFNGYSTPLELFVKQLTVKYGEGVLPQYDITLTDNIEVVLNQIGQVADDVEKLGSLVAILRQTYNRNIWSELDKKLSRTNNDTAQGKITFRQGADFADNAQGQFTPNAVGAGIWQDENKNWHIEGDFLHARKKLTAKEVQIEDVSHIGGQQLLTAAGMHADFVVEKENAYRCFFLKVDSNGREVRNKWAIGDQAYVCTFNLKVTDTHSSGEGDKVGNHYLWRLVSGVSGTNNVDTNIYVIDGETYDASEYHFIDLSKTDCDSESDAPWIGDDIVQLGNRNDTDRQNAIILAGAGSASPYIRQFVGINSFTLPSPDTQIKPNDNLFTGRVKMQAGSEIDPSIIQVGATNLLLNTGFRGQHNSRNLDANTQTSEGLEMWSPSLEGWTTVNTEAIEDTDSASGKACVISNGSITQNLTKPMLANADYFFTFKGKGGSITLNIGEQTETIVLTNEYSVHHIPIRTHTNISELSLIGTATICELFLEKGTVYSTTWSPSPYDADEALDKFNSIKYITDAIQNASTTVLGGLILSNLIELGNYVNGEMQEVTAGMSGVYNNEQDIAFWGGGTLEKAIKAVNLFRQDPTYQPTPEEWASVANAVITHGGRAILNDAIFRGSVYAENGYFKGELRAARGTFDGYVKENFIKVADSDAEYDSTNNYYVLKDNINLELPSILGTSTLPKSYVYLPSDVKYIGTHARFYNDRSGLTTRMPFDDPELICENGFLGITFISDESTSTYTLPTRIEFRGGVIELIGVPSVNNGQNCCAWVIANHLCTKLNAYTNSTPILKTEVYGGTTITMGNSVYQIKTGDTSITPTPCAITMTPSYIIGEVNGHEMSFGNTGGLFIKHPSTAYIEFFFEENNGVYIPHLQVKNSNEGNPRRIF